jgi:hypothetical protein
MGPYDTDFCSSLLQVGNLAVLLRHLETSHAQVTAHQSASPRVGHSRVAAHTPDIQERGYDCESSATKAQAFSWIREAKGWIIRVVQEKEESLKSFGSFDVQRNVFMSGQRREINSVSQENRRLEVLCRCREAAIELFRDHACSSCAE